MKMLGATAAALLFAAAAMAAPAGAQISSSPSGAGTLQGGIRHAAPRTPGLYSRPASPGRRSWNDEGPRDRDHRPNRCFRKGRCAHWGLYGYGYGYGGIGHQDMIAGGRYGYFSQGGETRGLSHGRPVYDYDRGYPFEHYSDGGRSAWSEGAGNRYARTRDCSTETTRDRRTGRQVDIRVCRN